jgi:predicted site-specific integrase-resolvase
LDSCLQGTIGEVIIAHRDRLSRFGFDLINLLVDKSGGKITVLDDEKDKSSEQELAEDLLSIIHIFSCRQMGKRAYTAKRTQKHENTVEVEGESEGDN